VPHHPNLGWWGESCPIKFIAQAWQVNVPNLETLAPTVETEIQGMKKQDRFDTSVNFPLAWHSIFPEFGDCAAVRVLTHMLSY